MSKIRSRRPKTTGNQMSPVDREIAKLDGVYYKLREAAPLVGVSPTTLRRLLSSDEVKAPSKELLLGQMVVYLYTPEDIEELREYYRTRRSSRR